MIPITGLLLKAPGISENPFAANRDVLIPKSLLPFETVTASGAGYRLQYQMEFALAPEKRTLLFDELQSFVKATDGTSRLRVREQRSSGGNFTDIANTMNDFLGSILYATVLIALSSFIVSFSRFALERRKSVHILLWIGLGEKKLVRSVFWRFLTLFLAIGAICLTLFSLVPGIGLPLVYK